MSERFLAARVAADETGMRPSCATGLECNGEESQLLAVYAIFNKKDCGAQGDLTLEEKHVPEERHCKACSHIVLNRRYIQLKGRNLERTFSH